MFVNRDFVLGALLLLLLGCGKGTHDPNQGPGAIAVGESVPVVDPADLKALRQLWDKHGGGTTTDATKKVCKPGADIPAIEFPLSQIWLLDQMEHKRMAPWMKNGKPDDAVFRAIATIPMTGIGVGHPTNGFPFDADEFFRRLGNL